MASELYDCYVSDVDGDTVTIHLRVTGATDWPPLDAPTTAFMMLSEAAEEVSASPLQFFGHDVYRDEQWRADHLLGIIKDVELGADQGSTRTTWTTRTRPTRSRPPTTGSTTSSR